MQQVNTLTIIIISFSLFISSLYSQSDASFPIEETIIPFHFTPTSKPMLHLGGIQEQNGIRLLSGLQFQPTENLLIGGILSPSKIDTDLSIYYHMAIGYIPIWKLLNISSNMFQIGMHRHRFGEDGDKRWFSFSFMESARFGSFNLNLCWNRLFTQNRNRNTILISTDLNIVKSIHIRPGAIGYFSQSFDYIPFLFVSIDL